MVKFVPQQEEDHREELSCYVADRENFAPIATEAGLRRKFGNWVI
jgi:hypothetical protein